MASPKYVAQEYPQLMELRKITPAQSQVHLVLYNGYVKRANAMVELTNRLGKANPAWQEIKRRIGFEINGILLHDLYFQNLGPRSPRVETTDFAKLAIEQFGNLDKWRADMLATAKLPGVGWAVTFTDSSQRLFNFWVERHDIGVPIDWKPLLVLDCWEHAFSVYLDPTQRDQYLKDFFENINWDAVDARL